MTTPVIHLHNLSKTFRPNARPGEIVRGLLHGIGLSHQPSIGFHALQNINLSVSRGQTWGIVGRNGSGKSTLLQLIAGTLQPTTGEVHVHGRVAALLELGSGFHPEFTGRENCFFQGRLLGCNREEIEARLPDILDFAGIGDFIDRPVKTYSSGMMLRLAFSVTITLDPEILIVDEALAVGDEAFQRKCFARIKTLRDHGCTVLFVSHSGQQILELCDHALLLDAGEQLLSGRPKEVVAWYHKLLFAPAGEVARIREEVKSAAQGITLPTPDNTSTRAGKAGSKAESDYDPNLQPQSTIRYPSQGAQIQAPKILRADGTATQVNILAHGETYIYTYQVHFERACHNVRFGMMLKTTSGLELGGAVTHTQHNPIPQIEAGETYEVSFEFRALLQPGIYFANAGVNELTSNGEQYLHRLVDILMFRIKPDPDSRMTGMVDFCVQPSVSPLAATLIH